MCESIGIGKYMDRNVLIDGVFEIIVSFEWLELAYRNARRQKRFRPEVLEFSNDLDANIHEIRIELIAEIFVFGPYRKHWVFVPKRRLVMALPFAGRVVQWAIYMLLNPFYDKRMIEDSYACRVGKGSVAAVKRLQYWLRLVHNKPGDWYCIKLDISKYFYRINHDVLRSILRESIKDEKLLRLIDKVLDSGGEKFGLPRFTSPEDVLVEEWLGDVGMPIGNLTSQLFANVYLDKLDQYCKHVLHIRYYIRYMDDIIILVDGKDNANQTKDTIERFLNSVLKLDLNKKTAVRPVDIPIEFVGFKVTRNRVLLRKQTARRFKRAVKNICEKYFNGEMDREAFNRRIVSYKGMIQHCDSDNLRKRLNEIYLAEKKRAMERDKSSSAVSNAQNQSNGIDYSVRGARRKNGINPNNDVVCGRYYIEQGYGNQVESVE